MSLFRNLSADLGLSEEKEVKLAMGLLSSRKYLSFLDITDQWSTQSYASAQEHLAWNQLACLLKKFPFDDPSIDKEKAAMKKFHDAEHVCKRVNARFRARRNRTGRAPLPYFAILDRARLYIEKVIGQKPNLPKIWGMCDFGPGASVGVHGNMTHVAEKLCAEWTVTPSCAPYALAALSENIQIWETLSERPIFCFDYALFKEAAEKRMLFVHANKICLVPKTAKVHRTIAIEPLLNGFVQKGVDEFMRQRLRSHGIDLSDQGVNQELAKTGSLNGFNSFATIDLSSASDTISIELVKELLPPEWFRFLNCIRSPEYVYKGETSTYQKFTSMGNGFCFPLETLIFASIVSSCYEETGDTDFSVYGDDIIVRQRSALLIIEVLKYCGFSTNVDKTFIFGPFRESCGADFYLGQNVRPYYVDEVPLFWDDIFKWLNGIRSKFGRCSTWVHLFETIPEIWRFTRPYPGADDSITVDIDEHMGSLYSSWDAAIQNWRYARVIHQAVTDSRGYSPGIQMYGALRGSKASALGRVEFALRRKTRTRLAFSS
jgi:hypothetical protein